MIGVVGKCRITMAEDNLSREEYLKKQEQEVIQCLLDSTVCDFYIINVVASLGRNQCLVLLPPRTC